MHQKAILKGCSRSLSLPNGIKMLFTTKRGRLYLSIFLLLVLFFLFSPYILVYVGIKISTGANPSKGGAIDLPVWHMLISEPLIWTGHHISSSGTLWMASYGNDMEKEEALRILDRWPRKSDLSSLLSLLEKEKAPFLRKGIIYAIGRCQNDKALPFLEKYFRKGDIYALIAMCKMHTVLAEKKLLDIYQSSKNPKVKEIIWVDGDHSLNFTIIAILAENDSEMRLEAYKGYKISQEEKFYSRNKSRDIPLSKVCDSWLFNNNFSSDNLIKAFNEHPELSLDDKKFLLLGHAVLRSPKSIPFLKEISTKSKSEALRKLAKEILKVIPSELPKISKDLKNKK